MIVYPLVVAVVASYLSVQANAECKDCVTGNAVLMPPVLINNFSGGEQDRGNNIGNFVGAYSTATTLGKKEKAMFRAHSGECLAESQVDPKIVESLLHGQLVDDPALRRHVYCVLVKCKVIAKDGKLQKTALLAKLSNRTDGKNATKILENCADQSGETPEDLAWNLFRCGFERKAVLFEYMPLGAAADDNDAV